MPSRPLSLIAVLCACLGLAFGLAACGGDGDDKGGEIALTDKPSNPENGSTPGSPAGGKVSGGSSAQEDGAAGGGGAAAEDEGGEAEGAAGGEEGAADGGGESASAGNEEGKAVFTQSCAGCHTLADAGATGSVGPVLDETKLDEAGIAEVVRTGRGGMPSFGGTLEAEQIDAVAAYIAAAKQG